jgi:hypothetical protein
LAFLRFSRDKRGVENFYLVQPTTNRRGKVRPRVLYWFRSPPDVKVGREPFDPGVRRALEAQNPDVDFDWRAIVDTPIPSADADKWRERRRAERAAKHAAAEEESAEAATGEPEPDDAVVSPPETLAATSDATVISSSTAPPEQSASRNGDADRKRRRRRRSGDGRRNGPPGSSTPPATGPAGD